MSIGAAVNGGNCLFYLGPPSIFLDVYFGSHKQLLVGVRRRKRLNLTIDLFHLVTNSISILCKKDLSVCT